MSAVFLYSMIACYILYSPQFDKFYIGSTQEGVDSRLEKHNSKLYADAYSSFTNDWEIFLNLECADYSQAVRIERHIKKMKSRKYITNLKLYTEMKEKLILRYSKT